MSLIVQLRKSSKNIYVLNCDNVKLIQCYYLEDCIQIIAHGFDEDHLEFHCQGRFQLLDNSLYMEKACQIAI